MSHAHRVNREQTGEREERIDCTAREVFLSFHIYINMEKTAALKTVQSFNDLPMHSMPVCERVLLTFHRCHMNGVII